MEAASASAPSSLSNAVSPWPNDWSSRGSDFSHRPGTNVLLWMLLWFWDLVRALQNPEYAKETEKGGDQLQPVYQQLKIQK